LPASLLEVVRQTELVSRRRCWQANLALKRKSQPHIAATFLCRYGGLRRAIDRPGHTVPTTSPSSANSSIRRYFRCQCLARFRPRSPRFNGFDETSELPEPWTIPKTAGRFPPQQHPRHARRPRSHRGSPEAVRKMDPIAWKLEVHPVKVLSGSNPAMKPPPSRWGRNRANSYSCFPVLPELLPDLPRRSRRVCTEVLQNFSTNAIQLTRCPAPGAKNLLSQRRTENESRGLHHRRLHPASAFATADHRAISSAFYLVDASRSPPAKPGCTGLCLLSQQSR